MSAAQVPGPEPREPKLEPVDGGWLGRFRCGDGPRKRVVIRVKDERFAYGRARRMREVVRTLVKAGKDKVPVAANFLRQAGDQPNSKAFEGICRAAVDLAKGDPAVTGTTGPCTFRDVCDMWLSGALHQRFPKKVPFQSAQTAENSRARIVKHIYPRIGDLAVRNITQRHYDEVMAALPPTMQCRDKIAGFMVRVLDHARKLKLIDKHPIDPDTIPPARKAGSVAFTYLYPDEDALLLSCDKVPLTRRAYWAAMTRNGFRSAELGGARWYQIDFENGLFTLDQNKTATPRIWSLDPDVLEMFRRIRPEDAQPDDLIFPWYHRLGLPAQLRRDLKVAGCTRHNLFARSGNRAPLRVHDLRATFVTLAMAAGRNERWVKARTGHTTSIMLARYERRAGDAVEAGHNQWFDNCVELLWPETAPKKAQRVGRGVGQVLLFQRKTRASNIPSTNADPLHLHAGTQKSREKRPPASPRKAGGPPGQGGAGQAGGTPLDAALAGLTAAIATATAAGKWSLALRLTNQLESLKQLSAAGGNG